MINNVNYNTVLGQLPVGVTSFERSNIISTSNEQYRGRVRTWDFTKQTHPEYNYTGSRRRRMKQNSDELVRVLEEKICWLLDQQNFEAKSPTLSPVDSDWSILKDLEEQLQDRLDVLEKDLEISIDNARFLQRKDNSDLQNLSQLLSPLVAAERARSYWLDDVLESKLATAREQIRKEETCLFA